MTLETVQRVILVITYTERIRTLLAVDAFLKEREYRRGIADPDVIALREMVRDRKAELL